MCKVCNNHQSLAVASQDACIKVFGPDGMKDGIASNDVAVAVSRLTLYAAFWQVHTAANAIL